MATTWHGIGTLRWFWNHGRSSLMCNQYFFEKKLPSPKTFKNGLPIILDEPAYILGLLHFWHSKKTLGISKLLKSDNLVNSEILGLGDFSLVGHGFSALNFSHIHSLLTSYSLAAYTSPMNLFLTQGKPSWTCENFEFWDFKIIFQIFNYIILLFFKFWHSKFKILICSTC